MECFANRILYSLYCLENKLGLVFLLLFKPFLFVLAKIVYKYKLPNNDNLKNKGFKDFKEDADKTAKMSILDLDYGMSLNCSEVILFSTLLPYFAILTIIINRCIYVLFVSKMSLKLTIAVVITISASIVHFFCFRNDKYKTYFNKFKNNKNNTKWHIVCLLYVIGACVACYWAIILFNADYFGI